MEILPPPLLEEVGAVSDLDDEASKVLVVEKPPPPIAWHAPSNFAGFASSAALAAAFAARAEPPRRLYWYEKTSVYPRTEPSTDRYIIST